METLRYPLLSWQMPDGLVLGLIVGTGHSHVDTNMRGLKAAFSAQLQKEFVEGHWWSEPALVDAGLRMVSIMYRASYREEGKVFPAATETEIRIPAVHGVTSDGQFECFLPTLEERFYYYDPEQLDRLLDHFIRDALRLLSPEDVGRLLLLPAPHLSEIQVVRRGVARKRHPESGDVGLKRLPLIADRYPHTREVRKKTRVEPEVAWERGEQVRTVVDMITLSRVNVLLVGEPGVGKSAILRDAVHEVHNRSALAETGSRLTFWRTTPQRMVAGARYLGEWQVACDEAVDELGRARGVLWVVDFVDLLREGGHGPEDSLAAYLLPDLRRGRLQMVGEVTPRQLDAARRVLPGFVEYFKTVYVEEMDRSTVLKVMEHFKQYGSKNFGIDITKEAVELSYRLLTRFARHERFPGKAIAFLVHCVNEALIRGHREIDPAAIISSFKEKTGMPALFLRDDHTLDKSALDAWFRTRIVGQDDAVEAISSVVKVFKAGLNNPGKPVATMIFAGPTGVGKTASARALAQYFFGHGQKLDPLIRLDMSEFQHPSQVGRLIGETDQSDPGRLVREVRERPFCVLLLDELEKAHPAVFDVLLNVLDEGILVDTYGRATDFRNAIIIMTTNLGSAVKVSIGYQQGDSVNYRAAIASYFRPEFFNRIDEVVVFRLLGAEAIDGITRKELSELSQRDGFVARGLQMEFSEELVRFLSREGFDPQFGARPLQRTIERFVVGPLARYLLKNPGVSKQKLRLGIDGADLTVDR